MMRLIVQVGNPQMRTFNDLAGGDTRTASGSHELAHCARANYKIYKYSRFNTLQEIVFMSSPVQF